MAAEEPENAQAYWSGLASDDFYDGHQHWRSSIARRVAATSPRSVLEFGCNVGRNLRELRTHLPYTRLVGVDINAEAVERGRARYELDLRRGDESYLHHFLPGEFDVSMTISVLDHLQEVNEGFEALLRVSARYVFLLEPFTGEERRADTGDGLATPLTAVPHSYLWDYFRLAGSLGTSWDWTFEPYPLTENNLGPYYWLITGCHRESGSRHGRG
jgi:SAM-dependent methyltransferase